MWRALCEGRTRTKRREDLFFSHFLFPNHWTNEEMGNIGKNSYLQRAFQLSQRLYQISFIKITDLFLLLKGYSKIESISDMAVFLPKNTIFFVNGKDRLHLKKLFKTNTWNVLSLGFRNICPVSFTAFRKRCVLFLFFWPKKGARETDSVAVLIWILAWSK